MKDSICQKKLKMIQFSGSRNRLGASAVAAWPSHGVTASPPSWTTTAPQPHRVHITRSQTTKNMMRSQHHRLLKSRVLKDTFVIGNCIFWCTFNLKYLTKDTYKRIFPNPAKKVMSWTAWQSYILLWSCNILFTQWFPRPKSRGTVVSVPPLSSYECSALNKALARLSNISAT